MQIGRLPFPQGLTKGMVEDSGPGLRQQQRRLIGMVGIGLRHRQQLPIQQENRLPVTGTDYHLRRLGRRFIVRQVPQGFQKS